MIFHAKSGTLTRLLLCSKQFRAATSPCTIRCVNTSMSSSEDQWYYSDVNWSSTDDRTPQSIRCLPCSLCSGVQMQFDVRMQSAPTAPVRRPFLNTPATMALMRNRSDQRHHLKYSINLRNAIQIPEWNRYFLVTTDVTIVVFNDKSTWRTECRSPYCMNSSTASTGRASQRKPSRRKIFWTYGL